MKYIYTCGHILIRRNEDEIEIINHKCFSCKIKIKKQRKKLLFNNLQFKKEASQKIIHHHVKYLEIDGEDVVCHIVGNYFHRIMHSLWLYCPTYHTAHNASKRLHSFHDNITHVDVDLSIFPNYLEPFIQKQKFQLSIIDTPNKKIISSPQHIIKSVTKIKLFNWNVDITEM